MGLKALGLPCSRCSESKALRNGISCRFVAEMLTILATES